MMSGLPVALALSTTGFISHGDRNWPFLMLTGLPALQTLVMKSVGRTRKAGVCSTSTTLATSSIGVYSCTSVSTGTPICFFTAASRIGRAHVRTTGTNAQTVCRLMLEKKNYVTKRTQTTRQVHEA